MTLPSLCWQVSASVIRNLSWRADASSKLALREAGTATALMQAAMLPTSEQTLKSILSTLWNVSAHCVENKAAICAVPGALEFLINLLEYRSPSKSQAVVENAGGILRNMSSFVALHEDHRRTLRRTGVYQLLLRQLGSPSLTVVSNACGTLWNLSARCAEDQQRLRELGAVGLLRSLVNSKHKMIAMGSTAALKNLLVPRSSAGQMQADARPFEKSAVNQIASPGLHTRRQRSLDREFERHSDIGEFSGPTRQSFGAVSQPSNGWVMSSSAGGNLFPSGGTGRAVMTDQVEESKWRRVVDQAIVKTPNSVAVTGSASFTHGVERTFYDSQSVDNSPAVHRRVPVHGITAAVSSSLDYGQPVHSQVGATYSGWSGGMPASSGHSDAAFDHFSRRMERVHFTDLPDCSQDEPINFSMKYKESADTLSSHIVQRSSSSAAVVDSNDRLPTAQNTVLTSPITRFHTSRQSLPNGCSHRRNFNGMQPSQIASYSKPQFPGAAGTIQFDAQKFAAAAYGRLSMDMERPTNYSLQYAEHYEDDECSGGQFSEQPIDYSTRYMEPQTCRPSVFRPDRDEHSGLYADTIKTFCTEGTPMNYQSTATSMTDLSNVKSNKNSDFQSHRRTHSSDDLDVDEVQDFSRKYSEPQMEDENPSTAGRRAYQWPQQNVDMSAYSHSDGGANETGITSPGEQPREYCTEGTPPNFSHSGSFNSLRSDSAAKNDVQTAGVTLAMNTGPSADTSSSAFSKAADKFSSRPVVGNSSGVSSASGKSENREGGMVETKDAAHGKTVTFDVESNQVEQTPLMFSRSSSLGSLSSFDVRSVHSSVVSEYSVRASQVVSPSELPDSPCNTMPPSPSTAAKPTENVFFGPDTNPVEMRDESTDNAVDSNDVNESSVLTGTADTSALTVQPLISSDQSSPVNYGSEGGNMSSRTSLSALTCDGERISVCKEPRTLPLGEESAAEASVLVADPPTNDGSDEDRDDDDDDDDGVNSPVNEDDEKKLAECISLGMPPKKKKSSSKMTRSSSDGECLHRQSNLPSSVLAATTVSASASYSKVDAIIEQPEVPVVQQPASDSYDIDSPQQFATEDTPLNFSQSGSLSDLSSVRGDATSEPHDAAASTTMTKRDTTAAPNDDDSDVSLSDDDVPGGDELLSHLIEAAMPKKRHHWKPAVPANNIRGRPPVGGPPNVVAARRSASRSLEPPAHRVSRNNPSQLREFHGLRNHVTDPRRELESSNKNVVSAAVALPRQSAVAADHPQLHNSGFQSGASAVKPPAYSWTAEPSDDHMLSYAVEGTPDSYSRDRSPTSQRAPNTTVGRSLLKTGDASWNSSLSSLSLDSSLNAEPTPEESALLAECINAALPKSRGRKSNKKSSSHHQPLRTSPSGSSESSFKHRSMNLTAVKSSDSKTGTDITEETRSQDVSTSDRQHDVADGVTEGNDTCDIMQESFPDVGMLDIALDDESLPSGPSTEANNTVIYCGPALTEAGQSSLNVEVPDVTVAAESEGNTAQLTENSDTDIVTELSPNVTQINVADSGGDSEPSTTDLTSDQVCLTGL